MADKALKKVEDQLNCSICLDTYTDPKLLQCFHVYCQGCLVKLVVRDQQGHHVLTCPICRQVTPIPANGVTGLQPAFHINHLLNILDEHKKEEGPTAEKNLARLAGKKDSQLCSEHVGKALELYCETCGKLICFHCIMKKGKHHSHDYEVLDEAFEKYKEEITPSLEPMEKRLVTINKALAQCDSYCVEVSDQRAAVEADIHKTISRLQKVVHGALEVRKTELIGHLHQMTQKKLKDLAVQRDQIETTQAQLGSCIDFIKESFKTTSSQGMVLRMKTNITQRARELTNILQPEDILEPRLKDAIVFSYSGVEDIPELCRNCGQVFIQGPPDPSQCYTTHHGLQVAAVGEKSTVTLHTIDGEGKPLIELVKSVESKLVSSITGVRANCTVERRGQSQYDISYQPTIKGRHQLHVKVEGQHVRGSPFCVAAKSPVVDLTAPIKTIQGVHTPTGLAVNKRGELVVAEPETSCISVFTTSGEKLQLFGTHGSGQGQFEDPNGVAVDGEGNIFVADTGNNRIQKFTEEGQFLREVDCKPNAIAFNTSNGKLYVSDYSKHQVVILNSDLTFSNAFGGEGSAKGKFKSPQGIAFDSIDNVLVADCDNSRIQVFTAEGKFLRIVEKSVGKLNWPGGVAVNTEGVTFISEISGNCVSVFDHNGHFMSSCGGLAGPCGLAVDDCGVLCV